MLRFLSSWRLVLSKIGPIETELVMNSVPRMILFYNGAGSERSYLLSELWKLKRCLESWVVLQLKFRVMGGLRHASFW